MSDATYNIVRAQGRSKSIYKGGLARKQAISWLKHLKRMARDGGSHVYFDMVEVPADLKAAVNKPTANEAAAEEAA